MTVLGASSEISATSTGELKGTWKFNGQVQDEPSSGSDPVPSVIDGSLLEGPAVATCDATKLTLTQDDAASGPAAGETPTGLPTQVVMTYKRAQGARRQARTTRGPGPDVPVGVRRARPLARSGLVTPGSFRPCAGRPAGRPS